MTPSRVFVGLVLVVFGVLFLLHNLQFEAYRYAWPAAIILFGIFLLYRSWRRRSTSFQCECGGFQSGGQGSPGVIGAVDGAVISHYIGDVNLDLTGTELKPGENRMTISAFIGDIRLKVPPNMPVRAICSGFFGDLDVLGQVREGVFLSHTTQTPDYDTADKKLLVTCSIFIGDIRVQRG